MNKPEDWEIVRDKLLGADIYGSNIDFNIINKYLADHLNKTGEFKQVVYVSQQGFNNLIYNIGTLKSFENFRDKTICFYGYTGTCKIIPL